MDFVQDNLFDGKKLCCLKIVDIFSCYCHAIRVPKSIKGIAVVEVMDAFEKQDGSIPKRIEADNGSEFISKELGKWAYDNKVVLDFSRPGKPTDNAFIESFNGSFQDECLNMHWFLSLDDAYEKIDAWIKEYSNFRPHSSLNQMRPTKFIDKHKKIEQQTRCLPAAFHPKASDFASEEYQSAAPENGCLSDEPLAPQ